jgi:hypothetical protein
LLETVFFFDVRDQSQGFIHDGQVLCHSVTSPAELCFAFNCNSFVGSYLEARVVGGRDEENGSAIV